METSRKNESGLAPTSSRAASRASRSASQAKQGEVTTAATSGLQCSASFSASDPAGLLVRMLLESSAWHSIRCRLTWKQSATPSGRLLFLPRPSTPRTGETGCGFWRTPMAQEAGARVETLFTKEGEPAKVGERAYRKQPDGRMVLQSVTLNQQVQFWPTPTSRGNKNEGGATGLGGGKRAKDKLDAMVGVENRKAMCSGTLNPEWVERLMGYPAGWTEAGKLESSE